MTVVKKAPTDRPVAVGDVIVSKPFGGRVATRGMVFLVTEHVAYYRCTPRACPGCAPNRYDSQRSGAHHVWRSWLDWYRVGEPADLDVREALAGRQMRMWGANARQYVYASVDAQPIKELRKAS